MKKYTIKDIAHLSGVSTGTVDRVLHKRGKVSESALKKVKKVLEEIDYKPNLIAKQLKNNKVYRICVLFPDPQKDVYWEPCVAGVNNIIDEFDAFGINITTHFFDPKSTTSFLEANLTIQKLNPDAVLLAPLFLNEAKTLIEAYKNLGVLVSLFNNNITSSSINSFIGQDLFQSGRVAAKLITSIVNKGEIAIIHIDEEYENAVYIQEKEKGFKSFFNELDHNDYSIITCKLKHPNFEKSLDNLLKEHPKLNGGFVTTSKSYQVAEIIQNEKNIAMVGYDILHENVSFLKNGTIDFLIHQNPKQQVYIGLKYLVEHFLFGKDIPNELLLPIDIINSENVKPFMRN
jgi:LacI family transcriptional regulator